jgi:hypothetical protein
MPRWPYVCLDCRAEFDAYHARVVYRKWGKRVAREVTNVGTGGEHHARTGHTVVPKRGPRI